MSVRTREESVNARLADVIEELGYTAESEQILHSGKYRPDVLFQLRGLRVAIEAKYADVANAMSIVLKDAQNRVENNIAHIAVAVIYPKELKTTPNKEILKTLKKSKLSFKIVAEAIENSDWMTGTPRTMMEAIRRVQESLVKDDIVEKTAETLSNNLDNIAEFWYKKPGTCDRLSELVIVDIPKDENDSDADERRKKVAKVSALVLANAYIFQEQLSSSYKDVNTLSKLKNKRNKDSIKQATLKQWALIEEIDYVSIFKFGQNIIDQLPDDDNTQATLSALIDAAQKICSNKVALRHDLMGRIYHRLIQDPKYVGAYYTSVSAATLLLKVVMNLDWEIDFGSKRNIKDFKIADLASGTGTLLMAATQALTDSFVKSRARQGKRIDLSSFHRTLMENVIHGYDILPIAVHLTASTLALLAPEVAFENMKLYVLPIGMDHGTAKLGSLDFLETDEIQTQYAFDYSHLETVQKGANQSENAVAPLPLLDLCVMNPPFVSCRDKNLLFGSHPTKDREKMQTELKSHAKNCNVSVTPGLSAIFVPLADKHVKEGGRIAFVLPIASATGVEWGKVRSYLSTRYHLEVVITSHEPKRTNFSENTNLSELLFVARKLKSGESAGKTCYVTLNENPDSIYAALNTASRVSVAVKKCMNGSNSEIIFSKSSGKLGEVRSLPMPKNDDNWTGAIFLQGYLAEVFIDLNNDHILKLPESNQEFKIPLCHLQSLGDLGYDVRDVRDAFKVDETATHKTPFAGFWHHDSKKVIKIKQKSNSFLTPLRKPVRGRKLKDHKSIWDKASNVLFVAKVRTNTHRVIAVKLNKDVVGDSWWEFLADGLSDSQIKALILWLNSSLGILMLYGNRAITEGPWMKMNKKSWLNTKVLDVRDLTKSQLKSLEKVFDEVSRRKLEAISMLEFDKTRIKIDDAICSALNLPDLKEIRELLGNESGLSGKPRDLHK